MCQTLTFKLSQHLWHQPLQATALEQQQDQASASTLNSKAYAFSLGATFWHAVTHETGTDWDETYSKNFQCSLCGSCGLDIDNTHMTDPSTYQQIPTYFIF